jgi:hypothetical protein
MLRHLEIAKSAWNRWWPEHDGMKADEATVPTTLVHPISPFMHLRNALEQALRSRN